MARNAYSVWFGGVLHSRHLRKGDALDAAYRHVNSAQHHNFIAGIRGSKECAERARSYSRLLGVLASTIPGVAKARSTERFVLNVCEDGQTISVRRDAY